MTLTDWITDTDELCRLLSISPCSVSTDYPLLVPRFFIDLMERGNPADPLLLQVLPQAQEDQAAAGFTKDPVGENSFGQNPDDERISDPSCGALNKYARRTLLLASRECGVHCRFCFRRHTLPKFVPAERYDCLGESFLDSLRRDSSIEEVILSGGDPLMLDDRALDSLLQSLLRINHVRRIRIHSRLPIVMPGRLTPVLAAVLTLPIPIYFVLHINHPNELSGEFLERRELLTHPILLSQTVLLRQINDRVETLHSLFTRLIDARILPYYLHQLDKVEGAAHFEVASEEGLRILNGLRERLPGYAVPTYVREVIGKGSKEVVTK